VADKIHQAKAYLSYWLDAVDEHSLHSPFFFDFYTKIVKSQGDQENPLIENLRQKLSRDSRKITIKELGSRASEKSRSVSEITQVSISPLKFSAMYSRMIHYFKAKTVLELGTSFGINTLYLADNKDVEVTTLEGAAAIAEIAQDTFEFAANDKIRLIEGNIDDTLTKYIQSVRKVDFVLMDANHRYMPTLNYFEKLTPRLTEKSVVVIDDIHYSSEMEKAWLELKKQTLVYGSADLYRCGILFFDPSLNKQHVILQV
jgi:predicted O-methyltransferase YrrM